MRCSAVGLPGQQGGGAAKSSRALETECSVGELSAAVILSPEWRKSGGGVQAVGQRRTANARCAILQLEITIVEVTHPASRVT
jgi:hypothetical protein